MKIKKIADGLNVSKLLWALQANPQLWDSINSRTEPPDSPHHGLSDIWARYAPPETAGQDGPHESVWYPAADLLPVRDLVFPLMAHVQGEQLGGVLLTKIPAGRTCRPHSDHGWHARFYDKFAIQVQSSPGQEFHFEGESLVTMPGDVFWFDNAHTHWVTNDSDFDRITMIVCIKVRKGE